MQTLNHFMPDYLWVELLLQTFGTLFSMSWNNKHRAISGTTFEEGTKNAQEHGKQLIEDTDFVPHNEHTGGALAVRLRNFDTPLLPCVLGIRISFFH